jgi:hypothetical protein
MSELILKYEKYEVWEDQGGNIGIRCGICGNAHWKADHSTINPATGKKCVNCLKLKADEVFSKESKKKHAASKN